MTELDKIKLQAVADMLGDTPEGRLVREAGREIDRLTCELRVESSRAASLSAE